MISTDEGRHWRSVRGALPYGVVMDLDEWRDQVLVTVLRGNKVSAYAANESTMEWLPLAAYELQISAFWDIPGVRPQSFLIGDTLITTLPGRKLAVLNLQTKAVEINSLPGAIQMFSTSADGVLRCRCVAIIATNPYESRDLGKTWQEAAIPRFALMPAFKDKLHGVAYVGQWLASGGTLAYTENGGKDWIEAYKTDVYFDKVFFSHDGSEAYALSAFGARLMSTDAGKTWERVPY
jgi:hypothetical protein